MNVCFYFGLTSMKRHSSTKHGPDQLLKFPLVHTAVCFSLATLPYLSVFYTSQVKRGQNANFTEGIFNVIS